MRQRLERLEKLLLEDRSAILDGKFSALNVSSAAIDGIVDELEAEPVAQDEQTRLLLEKVQELGTRNASLLMASMEGITAARERIEMIRRATSELNTYSSDGTVENVTQQPGKVEKRA